LSVSTDASVFNGDVINAENNAGLCSNPEQRVNGAENANGGARPKQVTIVNELLMYVAYHRDGSTKDNMIRLLSSFYNESYIKAAKDILWAQARPCRSRGLQGCTRSKGHIYIRRSRTFPGYADLLGTDLGQSKLWPCLDKDMVD
jgi:hypothetical protein